MSNTIGTMKDLEMSSNANLVRFFQGDFKNLLRSGVEGFAQKIPPKYYKIAGMISGAVVVSLPFILKFLKKKHWAFYVLLGIAEMLAAFIADKEHGQRNVRLAQ